MEETNVDWIFQGPVCAVLIINLTFLLRIMWVSVARQGQLILSPWLYLFLPLSLP